MVYVILVIFLVVVIVGGSLIRRKTTKRGYSYVPDPNALGNKSFSPGEIPKLVIPTAEFKTEEIVHDEFAGDVSDDLLDPRNPHHAAWVKEHPEMESDTEWTADHPGDESPETT